MDQLQRLLHEAHLRYQRSQGVTDSATNKHLVFREPVSERWQEQHRRFRPEGFYRLHCAHDRPRWTTCVTCKRGVKEARGNFVKLMTGQLR